MEVTIMNKNIIIKSLLNGALTFVLVALVLSLKGWAIAQAIASPCTISLAVTAAAGSFVGYAVKAMMKQKQNSVNMLKSF